MNPRSVITHVAAAIFAFLLGWTVSSGIPDATASRALDLSLASDPPTAFGEILQIRDPSERAASLLAFLDETDPSWALRMHDVLASRKADLFTDSVVETLFASWWAKSDPAEAFAHIVDPPWSNRHPWVGAVLREWVRQDAIAAAAAAAKLPESPSRGRPEAARIVIDEWFKRDPFMDPSPILPLMNELELKARGRAVTVLLTTMIRSQGIESTERFVESIPSEAQSELYSLRGELMSRMTVALMHEDVDLAIQWTEKHGEGKQGVGLLVHLAHYWGSEDGPAALDWAIGLPERERKPRIIKQAWIGFLRAEPDEATAWIQAREPDEATKGVYAEYLRHFARTEPELALELAQRATDPEIRDRMLVATGRGWMRSDPESAAAWLAGLSPDLQAQIRGDAQKNSQPKPAPVRNPS